MDRVSHKGWMDEFDTSYFSPEWRTGTLKIIKVIIWDIYKRYLICLIDLSRVIHFQFRVSFDFPEVINRRNLNLAVDLISSWFCLVHPLTISWWWSWQAFNLDLLQPILLFNLYIGSFKKTSLLDFYQLRW